MTDRRIVPGPRRVFPHPEAPDFERRLREADARAERDREDRENGPAKLASAVFVGVFAIAIGLSMLAGSWLAKAFKAWWAQ